MRTLALVDLDGVLCNDNHRLTHALHHEWEKYFDKDALLRDGVWAPGRHLMQRLQGEPETEIQYLTGRREDLGAVSSLWLAINRFPRARVNTRPFSAKGIPLANFKSDFIARVKHIRPNITVVLYDDDPEVIRKVWEDHGTEAGVLCTWHTKHRALVKNAAV